MLRTLRSRRRPIYGAQVCAVISALLLLLSVSLLYTRLSSTSSSSSFSAHHLHLQNDDVSSISDTDEKSINDSMLLDMIDEQDVIQEEETEGIEKKRMTSSSSGYYVDHVTGVIRRGLSKRSIDEWDYDYSSFSVGTSVEDNSKGAFGSDDIPIDENVRRKLGEVESVEDVLMLKIGKRVSPLREGWGDWFDKKGEFLRRDRMFKSNLEALNPLNNPILQDPDGIGSTGLTRGDKAVQKWLLSEFMRTPFLVKKPLRVLETGGKENVKRAERSLNGHLKELDKDGQSKSVENGFGMEKMELEKHVVQSKKSEESSHLYADGKRWGYFPGLHPHLSFSEFMDSFMRKGKCDMVVFMVWNSPSWMYSVRHQRGLESLLSHHEDACVLVFSETIDLDFFKDTFVKDGLVINQA